MSKSRDIISLSLLTLAITLVSCHHRPVSSADTANYTVRQLDSLSFYATHHYTSNYNFVVKADSIMLSRQQPEEYLNKMRIDTVTVYRHDHIVVADIKVVPNDSVDSVWVQVARDQGTIGWAHESELTPNVVPDDPISQFISTFSNIHTLIFIIVICVIGAAYMLYYNQKRKAPLVHLRDIDSFYPTLLALIVALSATLYASIQLFAPDIWRHFYYHPTLNPFHVQPILATFLVSVWAMVIVFLAAIDDARHLLHFGAAVMYLAGLVGVCVINYIIFTITTLYYIGYLLLAAYIFIALRAYFTNHSSGYLCGKCGMRMRHKGRCPRCGAVND